MKPSYNDLSTEIKLRIFSLLKFDDILDCRLVCKQWHDLVNDELTQRNCFSLKDSTLHLIDESPLSYNEIIQVDHKRKRIRKESILRFTKLKYTPVDFDDSNETSLYTTAVLTYFGETVTHLDLSECDQNDNGLEYRSFVKNFSLFKVLNHLEINSPRNWTRHLYMSFGELCKKYRPLIVGLLESLLKNENNEKQVTANFPTKQDFDEIFDNEIDDKVEHKDQLIDVLVKTVQTYKNRLNYSLHIRKLTMEPMITRILAVLEDVIDESEYPKLSNPSVRVLTLKCVDSREQELLRHIPNVQEIHVKSPWSIEKPIGLKVLSSIKNKLSSISVLNESIKKVQNFNIPKLKHVKFFYCNGTLFKNEDIEECLAKFPTVQSIDLNIEKLPLLIFPELITKLNLNFLEDVDDLLTALTPLKNLRIFWLGIRKELSTLCIFGHKKIALTKVYEFYFISTTQDCCTECFTALVNSFTNLKSLEIEANLNKDMIDTAWMSHPNLEFLGLTSTVKTEFCPNLSWPKMPYLFKLVLEFDTISIINKKHWNIFCSKLNRLRKFCIKVENYNDLDIVTLFESNLPKLNYLEILSNEIHNLEAIALHKFCGKYTIYTPNPLLDEWVTKISRAQTAT